MGTSKSKIKRFTVFMPKDLLIKLIEITNERKKQNDQQSMYGIYKCTLTVVFRKFTVYGHF